MAGVREDWFPTSVWYFDIENHQQLNVGLLEAIYAERTRDGQGMSGRSTALGWHSHDQLHKLNEFKQFTVLIGPNVLEVARFNHWDLQRFNLAILNCWAIVNHKFASNTLHNHPRCLLSGVYYVKAPEDCGRLFFRDPREASLMLPPPVLQQTPWTHQKVSYAPVEGRMLIFPSWLWHGVEPNLSNDDRVCLSFNVDLIDAKLLSGRFNQPQQ